MSDADRLDYFTAYTDKLKAEAEDEKERLEIEARKKGLANNLAAGNLVKNKSKPSGPSSSFYFYNPTTVAYGKNEFIKFGETVKIKTIGDGQQQNSII